MKNCFLVKLACLYLISATSSCFKPNIKKDDGEKYASVFDNLEYKTSLKFLEITNKSSCFSPICCLNNINLMCEAKEFGEKRSELGKKKLTSVSKAVELHDKIFKLINCLFTKDYPVKITGKGDGWRNKNYNLKNAESVFEKYIKWFLEITEGKIESPLRLGDLLKYNLIYLTVALFKDDWAIKFDKNYSQVSKFLRSPYKTPLDKTFMMQKEKIKYDLVEINKTSYHIVALPYAKKNASGFKRYMVYLIPIEINGKPFDKLQFDANLTAVWKNFYSDYSKNNIKKAITNLDKKEICLLIPQINELRSEFNMIEIINDILKLSNAEKIKSTMKTYLNVNEEGTEAKATMATKRYDTLKDSTFVAANVPHISFIFDMNLKKILFITKYLG